MTDRHFQEGELRGALAADLGPGAGAEKLRKYRVLMVPMMVR